MLTCTENNYYFDFSLDNGYYRPTPHFILINILKSLILNYEQNKASKSSSKNLKGSQLQLNQKVIMFFKNSLYTQGDMLHKQLIDIYTQLSSLRWQHLGLVWLKKKVTHHSVFITHHSSLSFHHSSLITHHLKHPTLFGTITHLSSLNIFQLFVGPIHVPCAAFTLFIIFFLQLPVPKLTELVKKKEGRFED